jgi:hypothetical protein
MDMAMRIKTVGIFAVAIVMVIVIVMVMVCLGAGATSVAFAAGTAGSADASNVVKSTSKEQTNVEVTVYNSNMGLVKDVRNITLPAGKGELRFMDVAAHVNPVTVHVRSVNSPDSLVVLEQNYEYDLMDANKLLDKYVGKKIRLIDDNKYQDRKDTVEAELLSNNNGQIYRIGGEIYLGYPGIRVLPELPDNLIARPTLMWLYDNKTAKPHSVEVSYITGNITWKADYVLVLDKADKKADLSGWVTVDNKSGAAYRDAALKLVAGEVHRAKDYDEDARSERVYKAPARQYAAAPSFEEKALFDYHIYTLQRRTTLKENQTKQISFIDAPGASANKDYIAYGIQSWFSSAFKDTNPKQPVNVYVRFKNSRDNALGMPLPAGVMRLYKKDDEGSLQFIGEDRIKHTPKDEEIKLKVGEAFDIAVERSQTDFKQLTSKQYESEWEITLRNHKEEDVTVQLIEPLFGTWQVLPGAPKYTKLDASTIRFDVSVPKDKEVKVKYRVRVGY